MTLSTTSDRSRRVRVLGVPVDCVTMAEAMDLLEGYVAEGTPHLVITADASGIVQAQKDAGLAGLYELASLVTPDSSGVVWAANRKGMCVRERVSGVEIVNLVCARSADRGYRIYFLGGAPGVAELAAEMLKLKHPGCNIVGARHGFFPSDSDRVVAEEVALARPDFLFVAMGIPRQEQFIAETMDVIQAKVAMGVGGSLDVHSGKAKRAPVLFQRLRLEWLWRVLLNPSKFSKVKLLPRFMMMVLGEKR